MKVKILFILIIGLINSYIFYQINYIEKIKEYMDEGFHLRQTIKFYLKHYNKWNSKLTTFPGTFIINCILLRIINLFGINLKKFQYLIFCRLTTLIISFINILILFLFKNGNMFFILLISFLPIYYFYNFLYYTDTYSILFLIIYYFLMLKNIKNDILILLTSCLAVLMRQNNIIWINLFPLSDVIKMLKNSKFKELLNDSLNIMKKYITILIVDICFIIFFIKNGYSVVLGDKSHHEICCHLAQINHLLIFTLFFFPILNLQFFKNLNQILKNKNELVKFVLIFLSLNTILFIFNNYSYTHQFIYSDNRHYVFYYFKKIYNIIQLRYAILIYCALIYSIILLNNLNFLNNELIISFIICCFLCLVPSKLIELRYFQPVYIIFLILLNEFKDKYENLYNIFFNLGNILQHILINIITIYVFIHKPFINYFNNNTIGRFMY